MERKDDHKPLSRMDNPLGNGGFPDFLSPLSTNHPTINSNPREADIIKEEMMNSSRFVDICNYVSSIIFISAQKLSE